MWYDILLCPSGKFFKCGLIYSLYNSISTFQCSQIPCGVPCRLRAIHILSQRFVSVFINLYPFSGKSTHLLLSQEHFGSHSYELQSGNACCRLWRCSTPAAEGRKEYRAHRWSKNSYLNGRIHLFKDLLKTCYNTYIKHWTFFHKKVFRILKITLNPESFQKFNHISGNVRQRAQSAR